MSFFGNGPGVAAGGIQPVMNKSQSLFGGATGAITTGGLFGNAQAATTTKTPSLFGPGAGANGSSPFGTGT